MTGDRRRQIVDAAKAMLAEDPDATLAVRSVAARAGIGASTLRHYFPTQRSLHEAVFAANLAVEASDLRIADRSVPARERLRECLVQLLPPRQPDDRATVERWMSALDTAFGPDSTVEARHAWTSFTVRTRARIAGWLRTLAVEGAVPPGREDRGALFLLAVVDGITIARAVPVTRPSPEEEDAVLDDALSAVLTPFAGPEHLRPDGRSRPSSPVGFRTGSR